MKNQSNVVHLLEVNNLTTVFQGDYGTTVSVDHVSFHVDEGEVLCIVGESGCGKSVTSLSIMGLLSRGGTVVDGSVLFEHKNLLEMSPKQLDEIRGNRLTMIFQDPLTSLNPVFTIGYQLMENLKVHTHLTKAEAKEKAIRLLEKVGMPEPEKTMKKYPHTLSGGMRQRVMIAMAIACETKLLIADEPTTALDVTTQAQIMKLLSDLRKETGMAMILITHDIGLVANTADRVLVMYAGQIVEEASVREIFENPKHPYTRALLGTVPSVTEGKQRRLESIPGKVPEHYNHIEGCRFADRCRYCTEGCERFQDEYPVNENHKVRCHVAAVKI